MADNNDKNYNTEQFVLGYDAATQTDRDGIPVDQNVGLVPENSGGSERSQREEGSIDLGVVNRDSNSNPQNIQVPEPFVPFLSAGPVGSFPTHNSSYRILLSEYADLENARMTLNELYMAQNPATPRFQPRTPSYFRQASIVMHQSMLEARQRLYDRARRVRAIHEARARRHNTPFYFCRNCPHWRDS